MQLLQVVERNLRTYQWDNITTMQPRNLESIAGVKSVPQSTPDQLHPGVKQLMTQSRLS
jgi:hypothetical protein